MSDILYPNFLDDLAQYEQAEAYWQRRWSELIRKERQEHLWKSPWLKANINHSMPTPDGKPIFSAICEKYSYAIRVNQLDPSKNRSECTHWSDAYGDLDEITVVVVACTMTEQHVRHALNQAHWFIANIRSALAEERARERRLKQARPVENENLRQLVVGQPEDDSPRLEYANWYQANGDTARAAFVRAQIERSHMPADDDRQSELQASELRSLSEHGVRWLDLPEKSVIRGEYRRGFFEVLGTSASRWLEHRSDFLRRFPIRILRLNHITEKSTAETVAHLRQLNAPEIIIGPELNNPFPKVRADEFLPTLAQMPELATLQGFEFGWLDDGYGGVGNEIGDELLSTFLQTPALRHLEVLGLVSTQVGDQSLEVLSDGSWKRLRRLDLSINDTYCKTENKLVSSFSAAGFLRFANSATGQCLEELGFGWAELPECSADDLATAFSHSRLKSITIPVNKSGFEVLSAITSPSSETGLQVLATAKDTSTDLVLIPGELIARFVNSERSAGIRTLDLEGGLMPPQVLESLASSIQLGNLRELHLRFGHTPKLDSIKDLLEARWIENLTHLSLLDLSDDHLEMIANCSRLRSLRSLTLGMKKTTGQGMAALLRSRNFGLLSALRFNALIGHGVRFTDDLIDLLLDAPMPHLAVVNVGSSFSSATEFKLMCLLNSPRFAFVGSGFLQQEKPG